MMYSSYQVVSDRGCNMVTVVAEGVVKGQSSQALRSAVGVDLLKNHDNKGSAFHGFALSLVTGRPAHGWRVVSKKLSVLV